MTQKQFEKRAVALCRGFWPEMEIPFEGDGIGSTGFTWSTGLRVSLHWARKYQFSSGKSSNWIHFALFKLGEEKGKALNNPYAGAVWWKWNINISGGTASDNRIALIEELERRLNKCVSVGAIKQLTGEANAIMVHHKEG